MDGNHDKNKKVATAAEWSAKNKPEPLDLPSGIRVMVRHPSWVEMMSTGHLPTGLLNVAMKIANGDQDKLEIDQIAPEDQRQYFDLVQHWVIAATVEPKVAFKPKDDEVGIADIPDLDKLCIFRNTQERASEESREGGPGKPGESFPSESKSASA